MLTSRDKGIASWKFTLLVIDALLVSGSLLAAAIVYCDVNDEDVVTFIVSRQWAFYLAFAAFLISFYLTGLYEAERVVRWRATVVSAAIGVSVATLATILVFYFAVRPYFLGPKILVPVSLGLLLAVILVRWLMARLTAFGFFTQRALIVGSEREAAEAIQLIRHTPQPGIKVYGVIAESPEMVGKPIDGVPVVGELADLPVAMETYNVTTLIVATSQESEWAILKQLRPYRYRGTALLDLMALHEQLAKEIPLAYVNDDWLMAASMNNSRLHIAKIKRLMDIVTATTGLVLSLPFWIVVPLLIKLTSRGPVLYRQERLGRESVPFTLLKFRTMRADAEAQTGAVWAGEDDPRVTPLGRWLRKLRIDEIPQFINVLQGSMSLVGPRPERPEFVTELSEKIPFYGERLLVQPGLTGWAQVNFPYTSSVEETRRKLQYDLYYIKHMSFTLDCLILLRTVKIVLFGRERAAKAAQRAAAVAAKASARPRRNAPSDSATALSAKR
jgi:exopolysaccharide biosynthesis polyprenyl glycosylphosphotransferase